MDKVLARDLGERVRYHRLAVGKTQTVIAGLSGITTDYLYQIERGKKLPTVEVVLSLANALEVPAGALLGQEPVRAATPSPPDLGAKVHQVLVVPATDEIEPVPVADLRKQVTHLWRMWQTRPDRYSSVATDLPALLSEVEARLRLVPDEAMHRVAADLYGLVRTVAKRTGRVDAAAIAADRACREAEASGDLLRIGAGRWNLAHAVLADGRPELAEEIALSAASRIGPGADADGAAIHGSLMLLAGVAAARRGDAWVARDRVQSLWPLARRTRERNTLWTAFGPTNVAMHVVSIEADAGDAVEASHAADKLTYGRSPSIERRVAFLLDEARSRQLRKDYRAVLELMKTAQREAPEDVAYRPRARELLQTVIQRASRSVAKDAVRLAGRLGMDATVLG